MAAPTPTPRLATTPLRARPDGIAEPPTRSSMPLDRSSPIATRPVGFAGAESMGGAPPGVERAVEVADGWMLSAAGAVVPVLGGGCRRAGAAEAGPPVTANVAAPAGE